MAKKKCFGINVGKNPFTPKEYSSKKQALKDKSNFEKR